MATNPSTEVYLYKNVPLDPNNEHTILWVTSNNKYGTAEAKAEQDKYFTQTNKPSRSYNGYNYQRVGTNKIQIKDTYDNVMGHSYMRFRNQAHENKWWYCFITAVEYINENCTEVSYEVDLLQTYQFDWKLDECYIEREHSKTDNFGDNIVPESFSVSDYDWEKAASLFEGNAAKYGILINATRYLTQDGNNISLVKEWIQDLLPFSSGGYINGVYSAGVYYYIDLYKISPYDDLGRVYAINTSDGKQIAQATKVWELISGVLSLFATEDALISAYVCPAIYYTKDSNDDKFGSRGNPDLSNIHDVFKIVSQSKYRYGGYTGKKRISCKKPTSTTIKNKYYHNMKINNFPYTKITVNDGQGSEKDFKIENFKGDTCDFAFLTNIVNTPEVICYTLNHNVGSSKWNVPDNPLGPYTANEFCEKNDLMVLKGFPMCAANIDAYNAWLAQNGQAQFLTDVTGVAKTLLNGGVINAASTALDSITSNITRTTQLQHQSDKPSGTAGSTIGIITQTLGFEIYYKTAKEAQLSQIDNYFSKFGYACKDIKVPSLHNRERFTYVKTINSAVEGNFPSEQRKAIEKIFDNGITFWSSKHITSIGNYPNAGSKAFENKCL